MGDFGATANNCLIVPLRLTGPRHSHNWPDGQGGARAGIGYAACLNLAGRTCLHLAARTGGNTRRD